MAKKQILKKSTKKAIDLTANWLLVVAGLNWAMSLFDWNLVQSIENVSFPIVGAIIYTGIGIASLWVGGRMIMRKLMK